MTENREPDDRDSKRRKTSEAQEKKQQEKVQEKPKKRKRVSLALAFKTEAEEVNSEIRKQRTEVVTGNTKGTDEPTQKRKRVSLTLPFRKGEDGTWFIPTGKEGDHTSAKKTVNREEEEEDSSWFTQKKEEEEDSKRAIELSKEITLWASLGFYYAPVDRSCALPSGDTVASESVDSNSEVDESSFEKCPDDPGLLLFEMQVPRSNWLVIQEDAAAAAWFPTLPPYCESNIEKEIKILDCNQREWTMTLVNYIEEKVYLISKGWAEFADWHNLEPTDVIAFYMPIHTKHNGINFLGLGDNVVRIPEYNRGDFLFELELQLADVGESRLFLPTTEVETHFPMVKMVPGTSCTKEIVKFTDIHSKDWYMEIMLCDGAYMITEGWENFVREHQLEAMDGIMFYMPAQPLHAKHFLIEYVWKKECGSNLNPQPPGERSAQPPGGERSEQGESKQPKSSGEGEGEGF